MTAKPREALVKIAPLCAFLALPLTAEAASMAPAPVLGSSLTVRLDLVGQVPAGRANDINAPVAIADDLYIINQRAVTLSKLRADGTLQELIGPSTYPSGVSVPDQRRIMNIAGEGNRAYVMYFSTTLPSGFAAPAPIPSDSAYGDAGPRFELIYGYTRAADGTLSNPQPLTAFEAGTGHRSTGMLVMPDGQLLYARGDQLGPDFDGLAAPQDPTSTISKLMLIDPATGAGQIVASGLRNVQRLTYADADRSQISFSDIGRLVAEEINQISVADVLDTTTIENFGWGRNSDGFAREGTFYIDADGSVVGEAELGEAGFNQPFAQFGREDRPGFFAVSGPVASATSFDSIGYLFGDLASGDLFATLRGAVGTLNDVYSVLVQDSDGTAKTISDIFGPSRDEPRFFNFADGTAGVLLERSGGMYRVTQVPSLAAVPLPAALPLLLFGVGGLASLRRKRRKDRCS